MLTDPIIPIRRLERAKTHAFEYVPTNEDLREIAQLHDWKKLKIERFSGKLIPHDEAWEFAGNIQGQATMRCVISDAPIHFPLDIKIHRFFVLNDVALPDELNWDLEFDLDREPMPQSLDLKEIMTEAIVLELPDYPKLPQYEGDTAWQLETDNGTEALEETHRPFAALKGLLNEKNGKES